ncbi:MAG TPA: ATP-dependent metallopeptidase FtsH/Yme1/Tma family protein, partial [Acidimicrobiales bacterium]|nr:ATP-dependent metallopeptidase FtsH/Yme1/Tma family protein [Acidimicrobiales bacterium]
MGAVALVLLAWAASRATTPTVTNVNFSTFINKVDANQVATATVDPNGKVTGQLKGGQLYSSQVPLGLGDSQLSSTLEQHGVSITGVEPSTSALSVILYLLPIAVVVGLMVLFGRRAGKGTTNVSSNASVSRVSKSRPKLYGGERPPTRFGDVAGYGGAKMEVSEVVDFLSHPQRYAAAGAVGPRGVLMVGPPGTGKTLLARAVAGEAEVPFFATTGSSFVELFVGMGASRVRELFAKARQHAPSIVFIDELDAVGGKRGAGMLVANDEREQTLNELLAAMDGFDPATGVVVVAATNRPESLDPALLRPGRFDRTVEIPLPNLRERAAILGAHTKGRRLGRSVDLDVVARLTPGFSGADLANLMNEAAIVAVRAGRQVISAHDFSEARD